MRIAWLLAALLLSGSAHAEQCLSYAGRVQLAGVLERRTYPGPPNYESVARGDRPETVWLLRLDRAVCVAPPPAGHDDYDVAVDAVPAIQLVVTPEQYRRYVSRVGRRVAVSGTLFGQHIGHHHTAVLLAEVEFAAR
jgi:hypothetical protein